MGEWKTEDTADSADIQIGGKILTLLQLNSQALVLKQTWQTGKSLNLFPVICCVVHISAKTGYDTTMAIEIELKAHVDDPGSIREKLDALGRYNGEFLKDDIYWRQDTGRMRENPENRRELPSFSVRVRKESAGDAGGSARRVVIVTYKSKETRDDIEVNNEREFSVSSADPFEELLGHLGFRPTISKRKSGFSWDYNGISAELAEVADLGWFAELEILAGDDSPETVRTARLRLLELLAKLGIGEDRIESRYYTELLQSSPPR
jgi:adenylate cyclase class 2